MIAEKMMIDSMVGIMAEEVAAQAGDMKLFISLRLTTIGIFGNSCIE